MNEIKLSIEVRIEAPSENAARLYAGVHGIDVHDGKWYPNRGGDGGRFYVTSTSPFWELLQALEPVADPGPGRRTWQLPGE